MAKAKTLNPYKLQEAGLQALRFGQVMLFRKNKCLSYSLRTKRRGAGEHTRTPSAVPPAPSKKTQRHLPFLTYAQSLSGVLPQKLLLILLVLEKAGRAAGQRLGAAPAPPALAALSFRCALHISLGTRLFCLGLEQKWHKVSLICVIPLMWWEKRKLASSLEEMLMLFHNFYNDI